MWKYNKLTGLEKKNLGLLLVLVVIVVLLTVHDMEVIRWREIVLLGGLVIVVTMLALYFNRTYRPKDVGKQAKVAEVLDQHVRNPCSDQEGTFVLEENRPTTVALKCRQCGSIVESEKITSTIDDTVVRIVEVRRCYWCIHMRRRRQP